MFVSVEAAYAAQISVDDENTLNAKHNAERCEPFFTKNGEEYKAVWARATVADIKKMMEQKYNEAMLKADKDAWSHRTKGQNPKEIIEVCNQMYENRYYLY